MAGDRSLERVDKINSDFKSNQADVAWHEYVDAVNAANENAASNSTRSVTENLVDQGRLPDIILQAESNQILKDAGQTLDVVSLCNLQSIENGTDPVARELARAMINQFALLDAADGHIDGTINMHDYVNRHHVEYRDGAEVFTDSEQHVTETVSADGKLTTFPDGTSVEHVGNQFLYRRADGKPTDVYENGVLINHFEYHDGNLVEYMDHGMIYRKYSDDYSFFGNDHAWYQFRAGATYPANHDDVVDLHTKFDDVRIDVGHANIDGSGEQLPVVSVLQNGQTVFTNSPFSEAVNGHVDQNSPHTSDLVTVLFPLIGETNVTAAAVFTQVNGQWQMQLNDGSVCHEPVSVVPYSTGDSASHFFQPGSNIFTTLNTDGSVVVERIENGEKTITNPDGTQSHLIFEGGHLVEADNFDAGSDVPKVRMHFDAAGHLSYAELRDNTQLRFNPTSGHYEHVTADGTVLGTVQGDLSGATGELQFKAIGATDFENLFQGASTVITTEHGAYSYRADGTLAEVDLGATVGMVSGTQRILCDAAGHPMSIILDRNDASTPDRYFALIGGVWRETESDFSTPLPGAAGLEPPGQSVVDLAAGTITLVYADHTEVYSGDHYTNITAHGTDTVNDDGSITVSDNVQPGDTQPIYTAQPSDDYLLSGIELPAQPGDNIQVGWVKDPSTGAWTYHAPSSDGNTQNDIHIQGPSNAIGDPYVNATEGDSKNGDITFTLADGSKVEYDRHGNIVETVNGAVTRDFEYHDGYLTRVTPPGISLQVQLPVTDGSAPIYNITDAAGNRVAVTVSISPEGVYTQATADGARDVYLTNGDIEKHNTDRSWELVHADGRHEYHVDGIVIHYDANNEVINYSFDSAYVVPDALKTSHSQHMEMVDESALFDFLTSDAGARLRSMISDSQGYIAFASVDEAYKLIGKTPPGFSADEVSYLTKLHESFFDLSESHTVISTSAELRQVADAGFAKVDPAVVGSDAGVALSFITNPANDILNADRTSISKDKVDVLYDSLSAAGNETRYSEAERAFITALHDSFYRLTSNPSDQSLPLDQLAHDAGYENWAGLSAMYTSSATHPLYNADRATISTIVTKRIVDTEYALEIDYTTPSGSKLVVGYRNVGAEGAEINQIAEPNGTTIDHLVLQSDGSYSFTATAADGTTTQQHARITIDSAHGTVLFDFGNGHTELINADGSRTVCDGTGQPSRTLTVDAAGHEHVAKVDYGNGKFTEYSYNTSGDLIHVSLPNGLSLDRKDAHSDFVLTPLGVTLTAEQFQVSNDGNLSIVDGASTTRVVSPTGEVAPLSTPSGLVTRNADGTMQVENAHSYYSKIIFDGRTGRVIELDRVGEPNATIRFDYTNPDAIVVNVNGQVITSPGDRVTVGADGQFTITHSDRTFDKHNADGSIESHNPVLHTELDRDSFGNITKVISDSDSAHPVVREFQYATPPGPNAHLIRIVQGSTEWEPDPNNPQVWLRFGTVNHERILDMDDRQQTRPGPVSVTNDGADAGKVVFGNTSAPPFEYWNTNGTTELHNADMSIVEADAHGQITKVTFADQTTREFTYASGAELGVVTQIKDTDGSVWKLVPTADDPNHWMHYASDQPGAAAGNPADGHFRVGFADSNGTLRIEHTSTYGTEDVFTTDGKVNGAVARNIIDAPVEAPLVVAPEVPIVPAAVEPPHYDRSDALVSAESQLAYLSTLKPWEYNDLKNANGGISLDSLNHYIETHSAGDPHTNQQLLAGAIYMRDNFAAIQGATHRADASYILISDLQTYTNGLNDASIDASNLTPLQKTLMKQLTDGMFVYQVQQGDVPISIGMKSLIAQGFENPTQQQAMLEARRIMRLNGWDETADPGGNTWVSLYVGQRLILQSPDAIEQYKQAILSGVNVDLHNLARESGIVGGDNDRGVGDPANQPVADRSTWTSDTTLPAGITHIHNSSYPYNDETRFSNGTSIVRNTGTGRLELFSADGTRLGVVDDTYLQQGQFKPTVSGGTLSYRYLDAQSGDEVSVTVNNGVATKTWEGNSAGKIETEYPNGLRDRTRAGGLRTITFPDHSEMIEQPDRRYYINGIRINGIPLIAQDGSLAYMYVNPNNSADTITVAVDRNGVQTVTHSVVAENQQAAA
ncbi:MAG: hypothetical protein JST89_24235 [Cyanobacteria bacterium SZAS-4]|nr:hypothetical protein [Cyanobacteria bacterium SZAS-4]